MTTPSDNTSSTSTIFNVPNQLTAARLILSIVLFVLLAIAEGRDPATTSTLYLTSMILFLIAAGTDWLDGFWARRYGQVTTLGRIFDPFVDKIIICGVFIYLGAVTDRGSGVASWMAVVVVGRELLVTALRGFIEQRGTDFSASMAGKLKMVFQCAAAAVSLYALSRYDAANPELPTWLLSLLTALVWVAILSTVYSGIGYIFAAVRVLRKP